NEIERCGTNSRVKQGTVFNAEIASPEPDKGFLHHVFGIGRAPHPLPGEQDQPGRELRKTDFPIFMGGDILHDPSRSLLLRRRQLLNLFKSQLTKCGGLTDMALNAPSLISFRMCLSSGFKLGKARWVKAKVDRPFRRAM